MDKNGQNRGGARQGSGRKPKGNITLVLSDGKSKNVAVKEFMERAQKNGSEFLAKRIYSEIYCWLDEAGVIKKIPDHLLQLYSVTIARWIQAEDFISQTGLIGRHPTTGNPMASPYVSLSIEFSKQATSIWYQIYQIIKDSTEEQVAPEEPSNTLLSLLRKADA